MKSFLFAFSVLTLLALTKSLPCRGDMCGRPFYSEDDDDEGVFYIREYSHNSASSNDDDNNDKNPEKDNNFALPSASYQQKRPNRQRPSNQQSVGPNTPDQGPYQSNQQPSNPMTPFDENQETQFTPNPDRSNQGHYKSLSRGDNEGYYQNNDVGSNQRYPGSGHQGGSGGYYQNNGANNGATATILADSQNTPLTLETGTTIKISSISKNNYGYTLLL